MFRWGTTKEEEGEGGESSFRSYHKFHRATYFAPLFGRIFRYPRTEPCSRNPFQSTLAVTLVHRSIRVYCEFRYSAPSFGNVFAPSMNLTKNPCREFLTSLPLYRSISLSLSRGARVCSLFYGISVCCSRRGNRIAPRESFKYL